MSVKYKSFHRKNKRVLAQFKPGTVDRARTFNMAGTKYTYLISVLLDGEEKPALFFPQDVEELTPKNL